MAVTVKRKKYTFADGTTYIARWLEGEPESYGSNSRRRAALARISAHNLSVGNRIARLRTNARRHFERDPRNYPVYFVSGRNVPAFMRYCKMHNYPKAIQAGCILDSRFVHSFPFGMVKRIRWPPQPTETIEEL